MEGGGTRTILKDLFLSPLDGSIGRVLDYNASNGMCKVELLVQGKCAETMMRSDLVEKLVADFQARYPLEDGDRICSKKSPKHHGTHFHKAHNLPCPKVGMGVGHNLEVNSYTANNYNSPFMNAQLACQTTELRQMLEQQRMHNVPWQLQQQQFNINNFNNVPDVTSGNSFIKTSCDINKPALSPYKHNIILQPVGSCGAFVGFASPGITASSLHELPGMVQAQSNFGFRALKRSSHTAAMGPLPDGIPHQDIKLVAKIPQRDLGTKRYKSQSVYAPQTSRIVSCDNSIQENEVDPSLRNRVVSMTHLDKANEIRDQKTSMNIHDNAEFDAQENSLSSSISADDREAAEIMTNLALSRSPKTQKNTKSRNFLSSAKDMHKSSTSLTTIEGGEDGQSDAKAAILSIYRGTYNKSSPNVPAYADIEKELGAETKINTSRLLTLLLRNVMAKVFEPVRYKLACSPQDLVLNAYAVLCPLCGTAIFLSKLGTMNCWKSHLNNSHMHGGSGKLIADQFEKIENGFEAVVPKGFTELEFSDLCGVKRPDKAPLDDVNSLNRNDLNLIPLTDKYALEVLLLDSLISASVLTEKSVLLQEIVCFGAMKYNLATRETLQSVCPELLDFQNDLSMVSLEGFKLYVGEGHPKIHGSNQSPVESIDLESLAESVTKDGDLDWKAVLLQKLIKDGYLSSESILVQELLAFSYFYYGIITQRTPNKFKLFPSLEAFCKRLYALSCKCYDIYIGDGPTGTNCTRGKPVNPSKLLVQRYKHYGLSKKSLQRIIGTGNNSR